MAGLEYCSYAQAAFLCRVPRERDSPGLCQSYATERFCPLRLPLWVVWLDSSLKFHDKSGKQTRTQVRPGMARTLNTRKYGKMPLTSNKFPIGSRKLSLEPALLSLSSFRTCSSH